MCYFSTLVIAILRLNSVVLSIDVNLRLLSRYLLNVIFAIYLILLFPISFHLFIHTKSFCVQFLVNPDGLFNRQETNSLCSLNTSFYYI